MRGLKIFDLGFAICDFRFHSTSHFTSHSTLHIPGYNPRMFRRLSPSMVMLCVAGLIVGLTAGIDWLATPSAPRPWPGQAAMDRVIPQFYLEGVSAREAFAQFSHDSGSVIRFSPEAECRLDAAGPMRTKLRNVKASKVLVTLINMFQGVDERDYSYTEEPDGSVLILHPQDFPSRFVEQRFWVGDFLYSSRALAPELPETSIREYWIGLIRETQSPRSWSGTGGKGELEISNDGATLIVRNTSDVCRQIETMFQGFRWSDGPSAEQVWMRAP